MSKDVVKQEGHIEEGAGTSDFSTGLLEGRDFEKTKNTLEGVFRFCLPVFKTHVRPRAFLGTVRGR